MDSRASQIDPKDNCFLKERLTFKNVKLLGMTPFPQFFETELFTITVLNEKNESVTMIDYNITQLRIDPDYIFYYMHWLVITIRHDFCLPIQKYL